MTYLIKVEYKDFTLARIGYAKDIKRRMSSYITENPMATLISYREGSMEEEKLFHRAFSIDKFEKGLEWFYWKEDTEERFRTLDCNLERIKILELQIEKQKNWNIKLSLYNKIKEEYDINYRNEILEKMSNLISSLSNGEINYLLSLTEEENLIINDFLDNKFYRANYFHDRMRLYCEFRDQYNDNERIIEGLEHKIPNPKFHQYYKFYGTSGCSARRYEEGLLEAGWRDKINESGLTKKIYSIFNSGDRVSMADAKRILSEIYSEFQISTKAKATDLEKYFKISKTKVILPDHSITNGFKLGEKS